MYFFNAWHTCPGLVYWCGPPGEKKLAILSKGRESLNCLGSWKIYTESLGDVRYVSGYIVLGNVEWVRTCYLHKYSGLKVQSFFFSAPLISLLRTPFFSSPHPFFLFSAPLISIPTAFCSSAHCARVRPEWNRENARHYRPIDLDRDWKLVVRNAMHTCTHIRTQK